MSRQAALRQMLNDSCPHCRQELRGHSYQEFALTVATPERKEALVGFFKLAQAHEWRSLSKFQDYQGDRNSAQIYFLKCPSGDLAVLYVRDPVELYDSLSVENWEPLRGGGEETSRYLPDANWKRFDPAPR